MLGSIIGDEPGGKEQGRGRRQGPLMLTTLVAPSGMMTLQKAAMLGLAWTGSSAHRWRRFSSETEGVRRAWVLGRYEDNDDYHDKVLARKTMMMTTSSTCSCPSSAEVLRVLSVSRVSEDLRRNT